MRTRKFLAVVGIVGLVLFGAGPAVSAVSAVPAASAASAASTVLGGDNERGGEVDLARLSARWWQWSIAIALPDHPFNDPPTHDCTFAQQGRTWFLGGVFNASGKATRDCTVPFGTRLLVPAINVECSNVEPPPFFGSTAERQRACARAFELDDQYVKLDGHRAPMRYVVSPQFAFAAPADNVLGVPGPVRGTSVSAGWWSLVAPSKGMHTLEFGGSFPDFGVTIAMTYKLLVV